MANRQQDIREMQIKTTMKYHFTLVRMATIKSLKIINAEEGVQKSESSYSVLLCCVFLCVRM